MLIPLGTDRPLRRATVVTWALILVNIGLFAAEHLARTAAGVGGMGSGDGGVWVGWRVHFTLTPDVDPAWSIVGYAFRHADWWHLAGNMLFLWVFGPNIEDRFGRVGFLAFYLAGAAAAGGLHVLLSRSAVIGASGAIAACTGAFLVLFPNTTVRTLSLLFVVGILNVPAWWFIGLSVAWDLMGQASAATGGVSRVAYLAHLGGYAFGAAISLALLAINLLPREPYDLFSLAKHRSRRQQIRAAASGQQREMARRWERATAPAAAGTKSAEEAARREALAAARAEVSRLMSSGLIEEAAAAYKRLAEQYPPGVEGGATALSRRNQYDLANHYFGAGDHRAAVYAYDRFLEAYPTDAEAPEVRLLLGRLNARYLNDPVRAKVLLTEAMSGLRDEGARAMAKRELEALG